MGRSNFTIALGRDRDFLAFSCPMTLRGCKKSSDFPAPDQQLSEHIDDCEITPSLNRRRSLFESECRGQQCLGGNFCPVAKISRPAII